MAKHELHPLCTLFPRLAGTEFSALVEDIRANGLREPITLHDGMILDGGNRYRACVEAGVAPRFAEFKGDNLVTFVLSANLHRRHMTPGQQAAIVASAQDWARAQTHGGARRGDQGATLHLDTVKGRATEAGASIRTQKMADTVARKSPELAQQVARGEISLPKAAQKIAPASKPAAKPEPDHDGPTLAELVDELQRENEALRGEIAAAEADDLKAEAVKWKRVAEHAKREQGVAMDNAAKCQDREKFVVQMLRRCAKAVGIADPNHTDPRDIAKAVETFAKEVRRAA
ncbi:MAG: hypothetical protein ACTHMO_12545 [Rhodanobacteraceae bacterium]